MTHSRPPGRRLPVTAARFRIALLVCALLAGLGAASGRAQGQQAPAAAAEPDIPTAPVRIDDRVLFRVRGTTSYPAGERAAAIESRILEVARNGAISADALVVTPVPIGLTIGAGDVMIATLVPADATLETVRLEVLAEAHRLRIQRAIQQYRAERDPQRLLRGAGLSLLMTVVVALSVLLASRVIGKVGAVMERRVRARIEAAPLVPFQLVQGRQLWELLAATVRGLRWLTVLVLVYFWLEFVLLQFPWTRPLGARLLAFILDPLLKIGAGIRDFIPSLLFLIVLAGFTRYGLRLVRLYFAGIERGTVTLRHFEPEWAVPTYKIVRTLLVALALIMAYPYLPGAGTEALQGLSVFAGLLFSLGAAGAVGNVIAGYLNTFGRVFRVGDIIKVGETRGEVTQVRLMTTRVRTIANEQVTIPNASLLTTSIVNYSALAASHGLILHTEVGIGYEVPWRQVHAMLEEAARRTPDIRREPPPFVLQRSLGDFAVVYRLNVYVNDARGIMLVYSRLHQHILDVFNEHGVQIMTPAYEGDPAEPKMVPPEKWFTPPAKGPGHEGQG